MEVKKNNPREERVLADANRLHRYSWREGSSAEIKKDVACIILQLAITQAKQMNTIGSSSFRKDGKRGIGAVSCYAFLDLIKSDLP